MKLFIFLFSPSLTTRIWTKHLTPPLNEEESREIKALKKKEATSSRTGNVSEKDHFKRKSINVKLSFISLHKIISSKNIYGKKEHCSKNIQVQIHIYIVWNVKVGKSY